MHHGLGSLSFGLFVNQITGSDLDANAPEESALDQGGVEHSKTNVAKPAGKSVHRKVAHGMSWFVAIPLLGFLVLYLALLVGPVPLPFVGGQARAMVLKSLPENMELELGATFLSLKDGVSPAIRFSPVVLRDKATGGKVEMEGLEIGFRPFKALLGQPGVKITLVAPRLQVVQDLFGPRLAQFEVIEDPNGGEALVRILEGDSAFPMVGIQNQGLDLQADILGSPALSLRSDNDWIVYNLLAGGEGLSSIIENSEAGVFSNFAVRAGVLEMHDSVYGLVRSFKNIDLEMESIKGSRSVTGEYVSEIGGKQMHGTISYGISEDGRARLISEINNLDFAAFVPFMDDPDGQIALHGAGGIIIDVEFGGERNDKITGGTFLIDLNGMDLRIQDDEYPVLASPMEIIWDAGSATFNMKTTRFQAGPSYADFSGVFVMGVDQNFGPVIRMSTNLKNIYLHPSDMDAPEHPIEELQFLGWSAPLYGALGIEHLAATRDDGFKLVTSGRLDVLKEGLGVSMDVAIEGATADDVKRIWPYFLGGDTRDWFVENIKNGKMVASAMQFRFPLGSIGKPGEDVPVPDGAMQVEILAEGVEFRLNDQFESVKSTGLTHIKIDQGVIQIGIGSAQLATSGGALNLANTAFSIDWDENDTAIFKFDGRVKAPISALVAIQEMSAPDALDGVDLPLSLSALNGVIDTNLRTEVSLKGEDYDVQNLVYSLNGKLSDFSSSEPISTYSLGDGQFEFSIDQDSYLLTGPIKLNGLETSLKMDGVLQEGAAPNLEVSANFSASDFKEFGFDVSEFMGGSVHFSAKPLADGALQILVNLKDASIEVADIGLAKPRGTDGSLLALVRFDESVIGIDDIDLKFGDVRLIGKMEYHEEDGLRSADFSQFAVQAGDNSQVSLEPINGGYAVRLRGQQLDLKPLMRRFFSLDSGGTGGPQSGGRDERIVLDLAIERALGFYSTTAFNLTANLEMKGDELRKVSLQSQFGGANSLSITTNQVPEGRVMSLAFGDLGTLLRFVGIYPRLAGGAGSLVMTTNVAQKVDFGEFALRDFALIDEGNVAQVVGNHPDSRSLIEQENRMDFDSGEAKFIRYADRIEISDAVLDGGTQGGTARGTIYTDAGRYDLVGTYIPLFKLSNAFQKLPILGPLLGGREGEGLFGVTFAVRGPLADPQFAVNPLSLLVPGAFRGLFEFRQQSQ